MDYFIIFTHQCLEQQDQAGRRLNLLSIEMTKLDGHDNGASMRREYSQLTFGETFMTAMKEIIRFIHEKNIGFINVQLAAETADLFTKILPQQFKARGLSMPFILTNFIDWKKICLQKYNWSSATLSEAAKHLSLGGSKDEKVVLKTLLERLRQQRMIEDSGVCFERQHEGLQSVTDFAFFKVIGLPFQTSKNEIIQKLVEPERFNITSYGLSLIFQHGKFSGRAVIKIPAQFSEMILSKDRMYFGKRYVEIISIPPEQYSSYKTYQEKQRQETRHLREPARRRRTDRSSHSSRSRSRDKLEIHSLLSQAAIKIRGLPFSLNNWDIEEIFRRFNFVRGSVKLGFSGQRKTGEAVILFPNQDEAERALNLHNLIVQGRYLQLRLITKENYDRFH